MENDQPMKSLIDINGKFASINGSDDEKIA